MIDLSKVLNDNAETDEDNFKDLIPKNSFFADSSNSLTRLASEFEDDEDDEDEFEDEDEDLFDEDELEEEGYEEDFDFDEEKDDEDSVDDDLGNYN